MSETEIVQDYSPNFEAWISDFQEWQTRIGFDPSWLGDYRFDIKFDWDTAGSSIEFGDFEVDITVPADHIVAATGTLQNQDDVLSSTQKRRMKKAKNSSKPIFIVTPEEAYENELEKLTGYKTWSFKAENVRDFAWASSRKFICDAAGFKQNSIENPIVMAMSFYPNEGEPLWSKYSTEAVMHTMNVYSR